MSEKIVIAIDGPAGSGKSTVARMVAEKLGMIYLDTGAMYRAITYLAICAGSIGNKDAITDIAKKTSIRLSYENGVTRVYAAGHEITSEIRSQEVNASVSYVATIPEVRHELVRAQRLMSLNSDVVLEGRDTTTRVFPDADLKIFMTADLRKRAERRFEEFRAKEAEVTLQEVIDNIVERDETDSGRDLDPLRVAEDAVVLDSTDKSIDEEVMFIVEKYKAIKKNKC